MLTSSSFFSHKGTEFSNQFIALLSHDMGRYQVQLFSNASVLPGAVSLFVNMNAESKRSKPAVEFALQKTVQYPTTYPTVRKVSELCRNHFNRPLVFPSLSVLLNILFLFKHFHLCAICPVMLNVDCGLKASAGFFWQIHNRWSYSYNLKINWTKPIGSFFF